MGVDARVSVTIDWDPLVTELLALRQRVGSPSYRDISERIQQQRMERGAPEYAARIARSSVYDAFRMGRTRVNLTLVREIGQALGAAPEQVESWITTCTTGPPSVVEEPAVEEPTVEEPAVEEPAVEEPAADEPRGPEESPGRSAVLWLLAGCLALNIFGRVFVDFFALPVYLDMVGTAIAAIALGPWRGATLGLITNVVCIIGSGWASLPFALVNIAGALVWGFGVRRWRMGTTLLRFFALNVLVALVCSAVAVPILGLMVGDVLRDGHDSFTEVIGDTVSAYWVALPLSNLMTSTGDKLISGFIALVVISALPVVLRRGVPLVLADGGVRAREV